MKARERERAHADLAQTKQIGAAQLPLATTHAAIQ